MSEVSTMGITRRPPGMSEAEFHERWAAYWQEYAERTSQACKDLRAELQSVRQQHQGAVEALREIAESDPVDNALDPDRNRRIAREYVASLTANGGQ